MHTKLQELKIPQDEFWASFLAVTAEPSIAQVTVRYFPFNHITWQGGSSSLLTVEYIFFSPPFRERMYQIPCMNKSILNIKCISRNTQLSANVGIGWLVLQEKTLNFSLFAHAHIQREHRDGCTGTASPVKPRRCRLRKVLTTSPPPSNTSTANPGLIEPLRMMLWNDHVCTPYSSLQVKWNALRLPFTWQTWSSFQSASPYRSQSSLLTLVTSPLPQLHPSLNNHSEVLFQTK